jgi:predicted GH43/DUF377 family glycosyl hydrolase
MKTPVYFLLALLLASLAACSGSRNLANDESWALQPIVKLDQYNPVLTPDDEQRFDCPVRKERVRWEEKDVFNPAAVVRDGDVWLLYRAQDQVGKPDGTSRIGLARSDDGLRFRKEDRPVLYPDNDPMRTFEWEGGCEDPRVVRRSDGLYVMTYTAYDGKIARLALASSRDLRSWQKHGLVLTDARYRDLWSKSGAIVCERKGNDVVARKVQGKYWMYFGDTDLFLATSDDLIVWTPVENRKGELVSVMQPRRGSFDSKLVEPGPFALITKKGILLLYNAANDGRNGDKNLPDMTYAVGQALFSNKDPQKLIARSNRYFLYPERPYEIAGQVSNVVFLEGMAWFKGRWLLYYGTADSRIAVAEMRE